MVPSVKPKKRPKHGLPALVAVFLLVSSIYGPAHAYFERVVNSARTAAPGGAFVGVADDPAAVLANPAGLALIGKTSAVATYDDPYGVSNLNEGNVSAAASSKIGVFGASWHHVGLSGALTENLITVAFARHLISTTQDASLSVGINVDFYRAAAEATGNAADFLTGGLGVLLRPFPVIGIGYAVRNLRQGELSLVEGGAGTSIRRQQSWGLSYIWHNRVTLSVERRHSALGEWKNHAGLEIIAHANLHLRGGVDERSAAGGFGVLWRGIRVDVTMASHDRLGATYLFSIGWLPKVKNPYAQSP
jgi:hypothetical protein